MWQSDTERLLAKNRFDGSLVFGTRAFNQRTGRDRHLDQRQRIRDFFLDPETGELRPELVRPRVCPACGAAEPRPLFVKDGFPHVQCPACEMVYVAPVLNHAALLRFYEEEASWTEVLLAEDQVELDTRKFEYGLDLIVAHGGRGDLLDVGCGPGLFLEAARDRGWGVAGMEMNERCVARLRERGIPVSTRPLEDPDLDDGCCDCLTLWEVLEHLQEPRAALERVRRLLRPGGLLVICVPNFGSLANRILHEEAGTFAGYSHVNFFTGPTLAALHSNTGFELLEQETIITELGTINNHLSFEHPYLGEGKPVLPDLTPQYIHENLLGSRLLTVARAARD